LVAAVLLAIFGQRWSAAACTSLVVPCAGAALWFGSWKQRPESSAPLGERLVSLGAVLLIAVVLCSSLADNAPAPSQAHFDSAPRLRDLVTQPAELLLLMVGALFGVGVYMQLRPRTEWQ
jgi:hypothetical protein